MSSRTCRRKNAGFGSATTTASFASSQIATLPEGTRQVRLALEEPLPPEIALIAIPLGLQKAVPRRQAQFQAGRYCAMRALEAIDSGFAGYEIRRAESGAPVWPDGVTGSITHTDDFAAAVVAPSAAAASVGIDTERIMSRAQAGQVAALVASEREIAEACRGGLSRLEAITLVFSAKESIFKCLHPITGRYFDFRDVRVDAVDSHSRTFTARLVQTLSPSFRAESTLQGGFEIEAPWVHTGIALRSTSATDRRTSGSLEHRARL